jgi:hypothetical protein
MVITVFSLSYNLRIRFTPCLSPQNVFANVFFLIAGIMLTVLVGYYSKAWRGLPSAQTLAPKRQCSGVNDVGYRRSPCFKRHLRYYPHFVCKWHVSPTSTAC